MLTSAVVVVALVTDALIVTVFPASRLAGTTVALDPKLGAAVGPGAGVAVGGATVGLGVPVELGGVAVAAGADGDGGGGLSTGGGATEIVEAASLKPNSGF